jgi:TrmH family RNA methyltransferase
MPVSLGAHSPKLDAVRALGDKAGRDAQGRFIVEGPTMLEEALASGVAIEAVYATEAAYAKLGALAGRIEAETFLVPERALAKLSALETSPGILAVVGKPEAGLDELLERGGPVLLLAGIADPGNAGTLLRSAEIFGVGAVVFGQPGVEPYNPKVVRASVGAIFRQAVARAGPEELAAAARRAHYTVVAATAPDAEGVPLDRFRFVRRTILAIGNERWGVPGWLEGWDAAVSIPQRGEGQSLNAATAGSIILYELMRQMDNSGLEPEKR